MDIYTDGDLCGDSLEKSVFVVDEERREKLKQSRVLSRCLERKFNRRWFNLERYFCHRGVLTSNSKLTVICEKYVE